MPSEKSVSVVVTTHERADILPRALDSVLSQLRAGDELILVDDGSTDDTASVAAGYGSRVRVLTQRNLGPGAARNHALSLCSGDYVTFLDDDDEYLPGRLEVLRAVLDHRPEVVYAFTSYRDELPDGTFGRSCITRRVPRLAQWARDEAERLLYSSLAPPPPGFKDFAVWIGDDYALQMRVDYAGAPFVMVRRSVAGDVRFPEDIWRYEDWEYTGRLSRLGPVAFLDTDPYLYRIPPNPDSRLMNHDVFEMAGARLKVLERVWGQDPDFLRDHGEEFDRRWDQEVLFRAKRLIAHGRPREAAEELARLRGESHAALRALTHVPAPILERAMGARRTVRRWAGLGPGESASPS